MITIYILTSDFSGNCSPNNRNNLEWLRKQDKINGTFNIATYPKNDYFRRTFIKPTLDDDMFIKKDMYDKKLVNCDGISYIIKKWNVNQPSERL